MTSIAFFRKSDRFLIYVDPVFVLSRWLVPTIECLTVPYRTVPYRTVTCGTILRIWYVYKQQHRQQHEQNTNTIILKINGITINNTNRGMSNAIITNTNKSINERINVNISEYMNK